MWNAAGELLSLDISGAINTLVNAVQVAGNTALAAGNYVAENVLDQGCGCVERSPDC